MTGNLNSHAFRFCLPNRLCRKDMLYFTRTDPKRDRTESTMGGSVGIPQTIVFPGWVKPTSGPTMWTIPWLAEPLSQFDPKISTVLRNVSICFLQPDQ